LFGPYGWLATTAAVTGVGIGLSAPAANNASLEQAPDDVGAITGLRGASRQVGAIIGVAVVTAVVARSSHEATTLGSTFLVLAALMIVMVPVVFLVPERRRGRPPSRAERGAPPGH
ncbi:MAG TPA: MFS transporter, partial [Acidimicrobiales bacterium]|nr:MFS transporter [Acidimicrobiales bacterium]